MTHANAPDEFDVRCPNCSAPNPSGVAYCQACASPLTAYGGGDVGLGPSAATLARLQRASERPRIVGVMAAVLALAAFVGPLRTAACAFLAQRAASSAAPAEGYIFSALGAVGAFLVALVLVPIGVFMLITAWAAWRQVAWAWTAVALLLGLCVLAGLHSFSLFSFGSVVLVGVAGPLVYFWMLPATREWYGKTD